MWLFIVHSLIKDDAIENTIVPIISDISFLYASSKLLNSDARLMAIWSCHGGGYLT